MSINLAISFSHPDAISQFVQYARIDNTGSPVFTTVSPNPTTSPAVIARNIPAGQYQIQSTPVYADGRICQPEIVQTPACPGLISINATLSGSTLIITYLAPSTVPKVRLSVLYPNGGSFVANYVNDGNPVSIGLPAGVFGNYSVSGQSVCDESSGFFSPASGSVTVSYNSVISGTFQLANTPGATCPAGTTTLYSSGPVVPGTTLFLDSGLSTPVVGFLYALYGGIIYNLGTGTGVLGSDTGVSCTTPPSISGKTSYSASSSAGSGSISAAIGQSVTVNVTAGGPPGQTYSMGISIVGGGSVSATNGTNSLTFTMPSPGTVTFTGVYTYTDSNGSGTVSVH